jgi:ribosomal protein S18 acetylase RimI-like enzyme
MDGHHELVARPTLTDWEVEEIRALLNLCNAHEGLDLKLAPSVPPYGADDEIDDLLYYEGGRLLGYCRLEGEGEVEVCGMVHPAHRRRGIGRGLLAAATDECRRRGASHVLLICEEASRSGRALVAAIGAQHSFAEFRMELDSLQRRAAGDDRLQVREAGPEDAEALARIRTAGFGRAEDAAAHRIAQEMRDPHQRFYLAWLEEAPVGSLKVIVVDDRASIYGFVVLPEHRGHGFGRQILTWTLETLLAEGWHRIGLEVLTDNHVAVALYRSCGFRETTTYGYYQVQV